MSTHGNHTPGPWKINQHGDFEIAGEPICSILDLSPLCASDEEALANAHLISAAPELLEACKMALAKCPFPVGASKAKSMLETAIAKAEGKGQ